ASATAVLGLRAPVAMGVAMAFAVSWKPFVKSKKSASAMTSTTVSVRNSTDYLGSEEPCGPVPVRGPGPGGGSHVGADSPVDRHSLRVHLIVNRMSLER